MCKSPSGREKEFIGRDRGCGVLCEINSRKCRINLNKNILRNPEET